MNARLLFVCICRSLCCVEGSLVQMWGFIRPTDKSNIGWNFDRTTGPQLKPAPIEKACENSWRKWFMSNRRLLLSRV